MQPVQFSFGAYQELLQSLNGQLDERVARTVAEIFQNQIFLGAGVGLKVNQIVEQQPQEKQQEVRLVLQNWASRFITK